MTRERDGFRDYSEQLRKGIDDYLSQQRQQG